MMYPPYFSSSKKPGQIGRAFSRIRQPRFWHPKQAPALSHLANAAGLWYDRKSDRQAPRSRLKENKMEPLTVISPCFEAGGLIPLAHTEYGADQSPALTLHSAAQGVGYEAHRYRGPKSPFHWSHRYDFNVYVLDCFLNLSGSARKRALLRAMQGHILQQAVLSGHDT